MGTWKNSDKFQLRLTFKLICCVLAVLLSITLVHSQSLSYLRSCVVSSFSSAIQACQSAASLPQFTQNSVISSSEVSTASAGTQTVSAGTTDENEQSSQESTNADGDFDLISSFFSIFNPQKAYADEVTTYDESGEYWWEGKSSDSTEETEQTKTTNGDGTEESPFLVSTWNEFQAALAKNHSAYIKLTNDIVKKDWVASNSTGETNHIFNFDFSGNIDGDSHSLTVASSMHDSLFAKLKNATIKNLSFNLNIDYKEEMNEFKSTDKSQDEMGLITTHAEGENLFENVSVAGYIENSFDDGGYSDKNIGSYVGNVKNGKSTFKNCSSSATVSVGGTAVHNAGGFIGLVSDNAKVVFSECTFTGSVSSLSEGSEMANLWINTFTSLIGDVVSTFVNTTLKIWKDYSGKKTVSTSDTKDQNDKVLSQSENSEQLKENRSEGKVKLINNELDSMGDDVIQFDDDANSVTSVNNAQGANNRNADIKATKHNALKTALNQYQDQLDTDIENANQTRNQYLENNPEVAQSVVAIVNGDPDQGNVFDLSEEIVVEGGVKTSHIELSDYVNDDGSVNTNEVDQIKSKLSEADRGAFQAMVDDYTNKARANQSKINSYIEKKNKYAELIETAESAQSAKDNWATFKTGDNHKISQLKTVCPGFAKYLSTSKVPYQDNLTFDAYFTQKFTDSVNAAIINGKITNEDFKKAVGGVFSDPNDVNPFQNLDNDALDNETTDVHARGTYEHYYNIINKHVKDKTKRLNALDNLRKSFIRKYNTNDNIVQISEDWSNLLQNSPSYYKTSKTLWIQTIANPYYVKNYAGKLYKQFLADSGLKLFSCLPFVGPFLSCMKYNVFGKSKDFKLHFDKSNYAWKTDDDATFTVTLDWKWALGPYKSIIDVYDNWYDFGEKMTQAYRNSGTMKATEWGWSEKEYSKQINNITKNLTSISKGISYKGYLDTKVCASISNAIKSVTLTAKAQLQSTRKSSGSIGSILQSELKKQLIESLPTIRTMAYNDPEFKEIVGVDMYNALMDTANTSEPQNTEFFKVLEEYVGQIVNERIYSAIGEPYMFANICEESDGELCVTEEALTNNLEYLATQGKLIFEGEKPIGCLLNDEQWEDFYNSDIISSEDGWIPYMQEILDERDSYLDKDIEYYYAKIGVEYVKYVMTNTDTQLNSACNEDITNEESLNLARLFRTASLQTYYDERNATVTDDNTGQTYRGSKLLRQLINNYYGDGLQWTDFISEWGPKVYDNFKQQVAEYKNWDVNALTDDQLKLINDFFNTYITYNGEFEYTNYLPSTRSMIYIDDFDVYTVDFMNDSATIAVNWSDEECSTYLPDGDRTWKTSDVSPGVEHPLSEAAIHEASMFCSEDAIQEVLSYEFDEESTLELIKQDYYKLFDDEEDQSTTSYYQEDSTTTSGGSLQDTYDTLASGLWTAAQGLRVINSGIIETSILGTSHFNAYSGGYVGHLKGEAEFDGSSSSANVIGGTTAGGFIGFAADGSKTTIKKSYFTGSNGTSDANDQERANDFACHLGDFQQAGAGAKNKGWATSAGGFIGVAQAATVDMQASVSSGLSCTRQFAGGLLGYAYHSNVTFDKCGAICGVAAPEACGGYLGLSYGSTVNIIDSYSCSTFDVQSNSDYTDNHINKILPLLGLGTWDCATKIEQISNNAGSYIGEKDGGSLNLENVYYLNDGNNLVRSDDSYNDDGNPFSFDDLSSGNVCYKLNRSVDYNTIPEDQVSTPAFGQIINDFSKGTKQEFPVAGSDVIVYKDLLCNTNDAYTNFDPRKVETKVIEFQKNNCTTSPDVNSIAVKNGDNFVFSVSPKSSYQIDSVEVIDDDNNTTVLTPTSTTTTANTYSISKELLNKATSSLNVVIYTKVIGETKPRGTGRIGDPYLIYTASELYWFNNHMKETANQTAQVKIMADIDYSAYTWTPIYSDRDGGGFAGLLDGNGHTIKGLSISKEGDNIAAFFKGVEGVEDDDDMYDWVFVSNTNTVRSHIDNSQTEYLNNATVEELIEENKYIDLVVNPNSSTHSGAYAHNTYIKALLNGRIIDNDNGDTCASDTDVVNIVNAASNEDGSASVGLINRSSYLKLKDQYPNLKVIKYLKADSGVIRDITLNGTFGDAGVAYYAKNAKFQNVKVQGSVTAKSDNNVCCGGLVAIATGNVSFVNCTNEAKVTFNTQMVRDWQSFGGILGKYVNASKLGATTDDIEYKLQIENCTNTGYLNGNSSNNDNIGNTTWSDYAYGGGIVGSIVGNNDAGFDMNLDVSITKCVNTANMSDSDTGTSYLGGIVGAVSSWPKGNNNVVVNNCSVSGKVGFDSTGRQNKNADAGGIYGRLDDSDVSVQVVNSIVSGDVFAGRGHLTGAKSYEVAEASLWTNVAFQCVMCIASIVGGVRGMKGSGKTTSSPTPTVKSDYVKAVGKSLGMFAISSAVNFGTTIGTKIAKGWNNGSKTYAGMIVAEESNNSKVIAKNCLITGRAESMGYTYNSSMTIEKNVFADQAYEAENIYYLDQGLSSKTADKQEKQGAFVKAESVKLNSGEITYQLSENAADTGYDGEFGQNIDNITSKYVAQSTPVIYDKDTTQKVRYMHDWETESKSLTNLTPTAYNYKQTDWTNVYTQTSFDGEGYVDAPEYIGLENGESKDVVVKVGSKYDYDFKNITINNTSITPTSKEKISSSNAGYTLGANITLTLSLSGGKLTIKHANINEAGKDVGETIVVDVKNNNYNLNLKAVFSDSEQPEYDETTQSYLIKNVRQLVWFRDKFNSNSSDLKAPNATLINNIEISEYSSLWTSTIGSDTKPFTGVFNGSYKDKTYTIKNNTKLALFGGLQGATVKNLISEKSVCTDSDTLFVSNLAYCVVGNDSNPETTFDNVSAVGNITGIANMASSYVVNVSSNAKLTIKNCNNGGSVSLGRVSSDNTTNALSKTKQTYGLSNDIDSTLAYGGFVAVCKGALSISNSANIGVIDSSDDESCVSGGAGLIDNAKSVSINSMNNFGLVNGYYAGGSVGRVLNVASKYVVKNSTNSGSVFASSIGGGIVGDVKDGSISSGDEMQILGCTNTGSIIGSGGSVGGVLGGNETCKLTVDKCINNADTIQSFSTDDSQAYSFDSTGRYYKNTGFSYASGLIGYIYFANVYNCCVSVNNCVSKTNNLSGSHGSGYLVGNVKTASTSNKSVSGYDYGLITYNLAGSNSIKVNNIWAVKNTEGDVKPCGNNDFYSMSFNTENNVVLLDDDASFKSGEIAYKMSQYSDVNNYANSASSYRVVQNLDHANTVIEYSPRISNDSNDYVVYKQVDGTNIKYSNYPSVDYSVAYIRAGENSESNKYDENKQLVSVDASVTSEDALPENIISLYPGAGGRLSSLKIAGKEFDSESLAALQQNNFKLNLTSYKYSKDSEPGSCYSLINNVYTPVQTDVEYVIRFDEEPPKDGDYYLISTADQFKWLGYQVSNGTINSNICAKLECDIDMSGESFVPIGSSANPFNGTFDGQSYLVTGISTNQALFGCTSSAAIIKDVNIELEATSDDTHPDVAGAVAYAKGGTISNVVVTGTLKATGTAGGIVAVAGCNNSSTSTIIKDCVFEGQISSADIAGGIVGKTSDDVAGNVEITGCQTLSNVTYPESINTVGGILGYVDNTNATLDTNSFAEIKVDKCQNYSKVGSNTNAGGIVGYGTNSLRYKLYVFECQNDGRVISKYCGGIVGNFGTNNNNDTNTHKCYLFVDSCINSAEIGYGMTAVLSWLTGFDKTVVAGGIVGLIDYNCTFAVVRMCGNIGRVQTSSKGGGIVGVVSCKGKYGSNGDFSSGTFKNYKPDDHIYIEYCYTVQMYDTLDFAGVTCGWAPSVLTKINNIQNITSNTANSSSTLTRADVANGALAYKMHNIVQNTTKSNDALLNAYDAPSTSWGQIIDEQNQISLDSYPKPYDNSAPHTVYSLPNSTAAKTTEYGVSTYTPFTAYSNIQFSASNDQDANSYNQNYVCKLDKASVLFTSDSSKYSILSQTSDGGLYTLGSNFAAVYAETHETLGSKFVVSPKDGYQITSIKINGVEQTGEKAYEIDASELKTDGWINYVEISADILKAPSSYVAPSGSTSGSVTISNYSELLWLASTVNKFSNAEKIDVTVAKSIDYEQANSLNKWTPIGTDSNPFRGSFKGVVSTASSGEASSVPVIQGLVLSQDANVGVFGSVDNCVIQDVIFHVNFTSNKNKVSGVVVNAKSLTMKNVFSIGTLSGKGTEVAGLVDNLSAGSCTIDGCSSNFTVTDPSGNDNKFGGLIAFIGADATTVSIRNCNNFSSLHSNRDKDGFRVLYDDDFCGGIVGYVQRGNKSSDTPHYLDIIKCANFGKIQGDTAGGIIARLENPTSSSVINIVGCENYGTVSGDYMGGIIGRTRGGDDKYCSINLSWCTNYGFVGITRVKCYGAGGIIGFMQTSHAKVCMNYCNNQGAVNAGASKINSNSLANGSQDYISAVTGLVTGSVSQAAGIFFCVLGVMSATGAGAVVAAVLTCLYGLVSFVSSVFNFVRKKKLNRWGESTIAGGLIAKSTSSGDNAVCAKYCLNSGNTYVIDSSKRHSVSKNDLMDSGSWSNDSCVFTIGGDNGKQLADNATQLSTENRITWSQLRSGYISYIIQQTENNNNSRTVTTSSCTKDNVSLADLSESVYSKLNANSKDSSVKESLGSRYFGQNLDKPLETDSNGNTEVLMSQPGYKLSSDMYPVYQHSIITTNDLNGEAEQRYIYSNWPDGNELASVEDIISVEGVGGDSYKEEDTDQPLAKLFDVVLNGNRSTSSVIADYESEYKWNSFEKMYSLLPGEKAEIRIDKSQYNGQIQSQDYSVKNIGLKTRTKVALSYNLDSEWYKPDSDGNYSYKDGNLSTEKDLYGGTPIYLNYDLSTSKLTPTDSNVSLSSSYFVKDDYNVLSLKPSQTNGVNDYYAIVSNSDRSIDKIINPKWQIMTSTDNSVVASLVSYDYLIKITEDGEATVYLNNTDINKSTSDSSTNELYWPDDVDRNDTRQKYIPKNSFVVTLDMEEGGNHRHTIGDSLYTTEFKDLDTSDSAFAVKVDAKDSNGNTIKKLSKYVLNQQNSVLNENLKLEADLYIEGVVNLCLDGHVLDLNGHNIYVEDGGALTIVDCNDNNLKYTKESSEYTEVTDSSASIKSKDTLYTQTGIVYDSTETNTGSLFNLGNKAKLNLYDLTVDISNRQYAVNVTSDASQDVEILLNNKFYGKSDNSVAYVNCASAVSEVKFMSDYSSTFKDEQTTYDLYLTNLSAQNIDFDDVTSVKNKIKIKTSTVSSNTKFCLASEFDAYVALGVDPATLFTVDNDKLEFAYGDKNKLYIAKASEISKLSVTADSALGNTYPVGETDSADASSKSVNYITGSSPKIYYVSQGSPLYNFNFVSTKTTEDVVTKGIVQKRNNIGKISDTTKGSYAFSASVDGGVSSTCKVNCEFDAFNSSTADIPSDNWTEISSASEFKNLVKGYTSATNAKGYRLTADIALDDTFEPTSGRTIVDLNGHTISTNAGASKDQNVFRVVSADSTLIILDDSAAKTGKITGSHVKPNRYHIYEETAGAVVVEDGIFCLNSGAITGNSSNGILGGAAITVEEDGKAFIGANGVISGNTAKGDTGFESEDFSAAVSVGGYFYNKGTIKGNLAQKYASSAINVEEGGTFVNEGTITENLTKHDTSYDNLDSFGTIRVNEGGVFTNGGLVANNIADFKSYAIVNDGTMNIYGASQIYNNTYSNSYNISSVNSYSAVVSGLASSSKACDIYTTSRMMVLDSLTANTDTSKASVVECGNQKGAYITNGWDKANNMAAYYFTSPDSSLYIYAHVQDNEIASASKSSTYKLNCTIEGDAGASSNINSVDYYASDKFDARLNCTSGYTPYGVRVNAYADETKSADPIESVVPISVGDKEFTITKDAQYRYFEITVYSAEQYIAWTSGIEGKLIPYSSYAGTLPSSSGLYYLTEDLTLNDNYTINSSTTKNIHIVLNGHSIIKGSGGITLDDSAGIFNNSSSVEFKSGHENNLVFDDYTKVGYNNNKIWSDLLAKDVVKARVYSGGAWKNTSQLPDTAGDYYLANDVKLENTWTAPTGNMKIDLNGHNITIDSENKNIINVNDSKSELTIVDSYHNATDQNHVHYIILDSAGNYSISDVRPDTGVSVALYGGIIGGANFKNNEKSGAVYVESGTVNIQSANIASNLIDNTSTGFAGAKNANGDGAAAITVLDGANVTLGKDARVCYNVANSVEDKDAYAVAGIQVLGQVTNNGLIENNTAKENAVGAVDVCGQNANFANSSEGIISNNSAYNKAVAGVKLKYSGEGATNQKFVNAGSISANKATNNSVAAVWSFEEFTNKGWITSNIATDTTSYAGVYTTSPITLDGESGISGNYRKAESSSSIIATNSEDKTSNNQSSQNTVANDVQDDVRFTCDSLSDYESNKSQDNKDSLFNIGANFTTKYQNTDNLQDKNKVNNSFIAYVGVENADENSNVTLLDKVNVEKMNIKEGFKFLVSSDDAYGVCVNANTDLVYKSINDISYLHVSTTEGGTASVVGDVAYAKNQDINVPVTIKANDGYYISSILVSADNNPDNKLAIEDKATTYTYNADDTVSNRSIKVEFAAMPVSLMMTAAPAPSVWKNWSSSTSLPYEAGSYKLSTDVVLSHTWLVPQGTTQIDLNGHNITISHKETIALLGDVNAVLEISDTNKATVNKFSVDPNTGIYTKDNNGTEVFNGGVIYGGCGENGGAFTTVKESYLALYNVNVVANKAKVGGAIYNCGRLTIADGTNIVGNSAETAGAIYNEKLTNFVNTGIISNNIASVNAGGIYTNFTLTLGSLSKVNNNYVITKSIDKDNKEVYNRTQDDIVIVKFMPNSKYDDLAAINISEEFVDKDLVTYVTCLDTTNINVAPVKLFTNSFFTQNLTTGMYVGDEKGTYMIKVDAESGSIIEKILAWTKG